MIAHFHYLITHDPRFTEGVYSLGIAFCIAWGFFLFWLGTKMHDRDLQREKDRERRQSYSNRQF